MTKARINNPALMFPEVLKSIQALKKTAEAHGVPARTLALTHLRASQINGCSVCVDFAYHLKEADEGAERLFSVSAWRDTPWFNDAERAALALAEAVTRLSDRADPVPDEIWNEAGRHYDERQLGSLVLSIAVTNVLNRLNVATRQPVGEWIKSTAAQISAEVASVTR